MGGTIPTQDTLHKLVAAMKTHDGWLDIYERPLYTIVHQGTDTLYERAKQILVEMELQNKVRYPHGRQ
jgi:hypothetical protein